jgi:hypothetical protein
MAGGSLTFLNRRDAKRIQLNHEGIGELLKSDDVRAFITSIAEQVLARAKADAPVVSGAYRDGLHIEQEETDRVVVRVRGTPSTTGRRGRPRHPVSALGAARVADSATDARRRSS